MCWNGVIRYIHCNQLSLNFDITRKDVFVWGFIQNENILFWFTIFYPNCFCVLFSIFTLKLIFVAKIGLTYSISIVMFVFILRKYALLFIAIFFIIDASQQYCETFRTFE